MGAPGGVDEVEVTSSGGGAVEPLFIRLHIESAAGHIDIQGRCDDEQDDEDDGGIFKGFHSNYQLTRKNCNRDGAWVSTGR